MNPFERYAEDVKPDWERRRQRIALKRRANRRVREAMIEQRELERQAELIDAERREELLAGDYGYEFARLIGELERLTLASGADLVRFIQQLHWITSAPAGYRHEALRLVSRAVMRVREGRGMPPFDDGLPWEPPGVFIRIREIFDDQGSDGGLCGGDAKGLEA